MKLVRIQTVTGPAWAEDSGHNIYSAVTWEDGVPVSLDDPVMARKVLAPVSPPAIIAIGLNYRRHAEETGAKIPEYPVVFQKGLNSLCADGDDIVLPRHLRSDKVDYECELGFVIKKDAKNVSKANAMDYVLGFTICNDVSARDWQKEWGGSQWCRAKSFDTFCPCGPCLITLDDLPNFQDLRITTRLDGETMQDSRTSDMIFDIPTLIEFLSGSTTLKAGTLVITGTPEGVGMARIPPVWLRPGHTLEMEIEGIGMLRNTIVEEPG